MSTKQTFASWTPKQAGTSSAKHVYQHYKGIGKTTNPVLLKTAHKKWAEEMAAGSRNFTVYIPSIRAAGTRANIANSLIASQTKNAELYSDGRAFLEQEMRKGYYSPETLSQNAQGYSQIKAMYDRELAALELFKSQDGDKKFHPFTLQDVIRVHDHLKRVTATKTTTTTKKSTKKSTGTGKARGGPTKSLQDRLNDVAQKGGYIDVDKMKADGRGAKTVAKLPATTRSNKVMANDPSAPMIAASDKKQYRMAMTLLGPQYARFADMYDRDQVRKLHSGGAAIPAVTAADFNVAPITGFNVAPPASAGVPTASFSPVGVPAASFSPVGVPAASFSPAVVGSFSPTPVIPTAVGTGVPYPGASPTVNIPGYTPGSGASPTVNLSALKSP